jgi:hypothetical protein
LAANSVGMSVDTLPRNGLIIVDEVGLAHSTRSSSDLFRVVAAAYERPRLEWSAG